MENQYYPFENLPLKYSYSALEPYIDQKTMQLHHDRHLQAYIDKLNGIIEANPRLKQMSLEEMTRHSSHLPLSLQTEVRNNAGGVYNHRLFFDGLTPTMGTAQILGSSKLGRAINRCFGCYDDFAAQLSSAAMSVFGSGYAWLANCGSKLRIVTTANQNTPTAYGLCPIIALDVWEHAYYLKHYNDRSAYIHDLLQVIDWKRAEEKFLCCLN